MSEQVDKNWWGIEFPTPYSPSDDDIKTYRDNMISGKTLMLGCTRKLIPFTDIQMDIDPWYDGPNVVVQDWTTNKIFYENIVGDGVLNFTKELAESVLDMASKHCKVFIVRSFNYKLERMRIAANFPKAEDLPIKPTIVKIFDEYSFFIWQF